MWPEDAATPKWLHDTDPDNTDPLVLAMDRARSRMKNRKHAAPRSSSMKAGAGARGLLETPGKQARGAHNQRVTGTMGNRQPPKPMVAAELTMTWTKAMLISRKGATFGKQPDANVKDTLEFVEKVTQKAQRVIDNLAEEVVVQSVAAAPHDQSMAPRPGVSPKRYRLAGDHGIVTRRDILRAAKEARLRVQSDANTARLAVAERLTDRLAQPQVNVSDAFGVEGIEIGAAKRLLDQAERMLLCSLPSWAKHHTQ